MIPEIRLIAAAITDMVRDIFTDDDDVDYPVGEFPDIPETAVPQRPPTA